MSTPSPSPSGSPRRISKRRSVASAAGLVFGGILVGTIVNPMGIAGAQSDDEDSTTTTEATDESTDRGHRGHRGNRGARLEALADVIGIDVEDLRTALSEDQTPAEIAAANGVSEETLVSELVALAEARLAEAVAEGHITEEKAAERAATLTERVTEQVNTARSERPIREGRGLRGIGESLSELGLTVDDIRAGAEAGQSLADVAADAGISEAELVDALVADATERIANGVESGRLTDDEAAERTAAIEERVTERINTDLSERPARGGRGHHDPAADASGD